MSDRNMAGDTKIRSFFIRTIQPLFNSRFLCGHDIISTYIQVPTRRHNKNSGILVVAAAAAGLLPFATTAAYYICL